MTECANVRILNNSEYVCSEICKDDSPHLVKKYSDEWKELVKESLVTDHTVADILGLNGTKCMKKFFKNYIMDEGTDEYIDQIHPPDNELHCMATVSCLLCRLLCLHALYCMRKDVHSTVEIFILNYYQPLILQL